jgi:hypothetical protein
MFLLALSMFLNRTICLPAWSRSRGREWEKANSDKLHYVSLQSTNPFHATGCESGNSPGERLAFYRLPGDERALRAVTRKPARLRLGATR